MPQPGLLPGLLDMVDLGPLTKGVLDTANPSVSLEGAARRLQNLAYTGADRLAVVPGTVTALNLLDDQGSPAAITSVRATGVFSDGAYAVGYSSVTQKVYLYRLTATMDGWFNTANVLQSNVNAQPVGALWTGVTAAPDVLVCEGLGTNGPTLYVAHTAAADANGGYFPTKQYDTISGIVNLVSGGSAGAAGTDSTYFLGVVSFNQALIGWGFGALTAGAFVTGGGATASYRPEMWRWSQPNFGPLQLVDSATLGDRVRSRRERIVGAGHAGEALYLGGPRLLVRLTGFGRQSWYKLPRDRSFGFSGPKSMVTVRDELWYWSPHGPCRIKEDGDPMPMWDGVIGLVGQIGTDSQIVAGYDQDRDQVLFWTDAGLGQGVRYICAFDAKKGRPTRALGPDSDFTIAVACAGLVEPVYGSTSAPTGPTAPPSYAATPTTNIQQFQATYNWVNGDPNAQIVIETTLTSATGPFAVVATLPPGTTSYTDNNVQCGTFYWWRAKHVLNGIPSSYTTPIASGSFQTAQCPVGGG